MINSYIIAIDHELFSLEPKFLYLSYLGLKLPSSVLVGLSAFLARPYLPNIESSWAALAILFGTVV